MRSLNWSKLPFALNSFPEYRASALRRAAADPLTLFYPAELASDYIANLGLTDALAFACDWARGRITKRVRPEAIANDINWHRWELKKLNKEKGRHHNHSMTIREKIELHKAAIARLSLDLTMFHRGVA